MLTYATHNEDHPLSVVLDPPAVVNTAVWTLRDDTGAVVGGYANVSLGNVEGATTATILVPAAGNQKPGNVVTAPRYVELRWTAAGGLQRRLQVPYRVIAWVGLSVDAADVRGLAGLNEAELPDSDIDLTAAALALREEIGTSFPSGTSQAQRLVCLRAFLDLKASLPLRVAGAMASDNVSFKRLASLDVEAVVAELEGEYDSLLASIAPNVAENSPTPTVFIKASSATDAITGA